jgi:hypothetical protein
VKTDAVTVAGTAGQQQQAGKISLPLLSDAQRTGHARNRAKARTTTSEHAVAVAGHCRFLFLLPAPHVRTLYSLQLQDLQQSRVLCWPGERREQSISTTAAVVNVLCPCEGENKKVNDSRRGDGDGKWHFCRSLSQEES